MLLSLLIAILLPQSETTARNLIQKVPQEIRLKIAGYLDFNGKKSLSEVNRDLRLDMKQMTADRLEQAKYYQQAIKVLSVTENDILQQFKYLPYNGVIGQVWSGFGMYRGLCSVSEDQEQHYYYLSFGLRDMTERGRKKCVLVFIFNDNGMIQKSLLVSQTSNPIAVEDNAQNVELLKAAYYNKRFRIGNMQLINVNSWYLSHFNREICFSFIGFLTLGYILFVKVNWTQPKWMEILFFFYWIQDLYRLYDYFKYHFRL